MRSAFFGNLDQSLPSDFALQNPTMLRVRLKGELLARPGTMVACQGQVDVDLPGAPTAQPGPPEGGLSTMFRKKPGGPDQPYPMGALMRCRGQGLVFMAANGRSVHLFYLENEGLTVSGDAMLAFARGLRFEVQPTQDDYITTVHGTGWIAVTTHGVPVLLDTGRAPTFVDAPSAVCWSTELQIGVNPGGHGGRALQLVLQGQGFVLVEAGEVPA
jgi:Mitochondrial biogenesis AIM24